MLRRALLVLLPLTLVACGSSYEGTVTYSVHLKNGDISGTTIADTTHIEGDDAQWKAFLAAANKELGSAPKEFEVTKARIQLDVTHTKNVGKLEDVLTGEGALFLRAQNGGAQTDIATFKDVTGTAQVEVDTTGNDLKDITGSLNANNFFLGLRSGTPLTSSSDFDAPITVTLDVVAR